MLLDEKYGRQAMEEFARHGFDWLGRPVELPARGRCVSSSARIWARSSPNGLSITASNAQLLSS
jgi:hypothetical protein